MNIFNGQGLVVSLKKKHYIKIEEVSIRVYWRGRKMKIVAPREIQVERVTMTPLMLSEEREAEKILDIKNGREPR